MSQLWTCTAEQHNPHSKAFQGDMLSQGHLKPWPPQSHTAEEAPWSPVGPCLGAQGKHEENYNFFGFTPVLLIAEFGPSLRERKIYVGFICLRSELDRFQYLRGLHLNSLWILKTTLLLGITSNSQFLDLPELDSVLVLIATILLLLRGKWNCNELVCIFLKNYKVTNVLFQLLLRICWILKIILM